MHSSNDPQSVAVSESPASFRAARHAFSLFEFFVVITVVIALMWLILGRSLYYQELAEKVAMEEVVHVLESALNMQYAHLVASGHQDDVAALLQENPINWLRQSPPNYLGEVAEPEMAGAAGNWLFNLQSRQLIYVASNRTNLKPGKDGKYWIRFHLVASDARRGTVTVRLLPVEPYVWL